MAAVRNLLDLSTQHLDNKDRAALDSYEKENSVVGPMTATTCYGWFMYATEEPEHDPDLTENLRRIVIYARSNECEYILFDDDSPEAEDLPTFEEAES